MSSKTPMTAFHYLSALRLLAAHDSLTVSRLADLDGRIRSNIRRDAPRLAEAGLVTFGDDTLSLTDAGHLWVQGQDIAEGVSPPVPSATPFSGTVSRWPLDAIRPNPLNRKVTRNGIEDLADSIIGAGDILQPLILTPPDANGVRTILAGERRWTAIRSIAADSLPPALAAGVPFIEREADAAEALVITLIENSQRRDLTPLEDALQLRKLADETGWNASELARKIGRKGRERDVQVKLKIAREATPEAIADYEETGSWDRLRDSVATPKAEPDCPVERAEALLDVPAASTADDPVAAALSHISWRELLHAIARHAADQGGDGLSAPVGLVWFCPYAQALRKVGLVEYRPVPGKPPLAVLTPEGQSRRAALLAMWGKDEAFLGTVEAVQFHPQGIDFDGRNYVSAWLADIPVPAEAPAITASTQTDIEAGKPSPFLDLDNVRLTALQMGSAWDLYAVDGGKRIASWVGRWAFSPADCEAFAWRLAEAFNAAQDARRKERAA